MANVNNFIGSLRGGGARPNQFKVTFPALGGDFEFLCRSAQIPAMTIGELTIPFRGRFVYVPGDRTYDPWAISIMNDRDFGIRSRLEAWMNDLQDIGASTASGSVGQSVYRDVQVDQMDRNDRTIRSYVLYQAWPTTLDAIDLAFDTNDQLEEFTVTFRFNYMTAFQGDKAGKAGTSESSFRSGSSVGVES